MSTPHADRYVDAYEFVRLGRSLEGSTPLAHFARLLEGLPEQDPGAVVRWSARGDHGPLGEPLIRLDVETALTLQCQRCLGPLVVPIESEAALQLVKTEAELDDSDPFGEAGAGDPESGHDFDKVLGSARFDLLEQVEDELILSIPYVPRHDACPGADAPAAGAAAQPSPFAALAGLKPRSGGE